MRNLHVIDIHFIYTYNIQLCFRKCQISNCSGVPAGKADVHACCCADYLAVWPLDTCEILIKTVLTTWPSSKFGFCLFFRYCSNFLVRHGLRAASRVRNLDFSGCSDVAGEEARATWVLPRMVPKHLPEDWSRPSHSVPSRLLGGDHLCASQAVWFEPWRHQRVKHGRSCISGADLRPEQNERLRKGALQDLPFGGWRDDVALATHGTRFDLSSSISCPQSGRSHRWGGMTPALQWKKEGSDCLPHRCLWNSGVPALLHESGVTAP